MPHKRQAPAAPALQQIKPLIAPLVEPVLERLDRHEELLTELRRALKIQFKRIADMQAHPDEITAMLAKSGTWWGLHFPPEVVSGVELGTAF